MKTLSVGDVMTRTVVVAEEHMPFKDLVRLMHEYRVSGVPVVDAEKHLVGIVTEADLLIVEEEATGTRRHRSAFLEWFISPRRLTEIEKRGEALRAADVMTRDVVTVRTDTSIHDAVRTMLDAGVKRLPVVDDEGSVLGIVSRRDLLTPYLRPDEEIRKEIVDSVIYKTMWIDPLTIDVKVDRGMVALSGRVDRRGVKEIMLELVHRVNGVVGVEDHLTYEIDDRKLRGVAPHDMPARAENWIRIR